ncbi:MAG: NADH-quinone oxidoreductase subunit [Burkholderiaceae bacterium]|nr:NADH-quinone oxidoreductase subunit [Burkholderiaceae bacterium]
MEFKTILFYAFSAILVLAALCVVTARNPVHSALFLVLSFFTSAALWILLKAEFLAIVLVLVYVGAVMVLFLFVVMMLDLDLGKIRRGMRQSLWVAVPVGLLIVFEMSAVLLRGFWAPDAQVPTNASSIGTTRELGKVIFTQYVFAFEVAAAVLLVAMIAAVALTWRRRRDARYNDISAALRVRREDRIRLVSMKAETETAEPAMDETEGGRK